MDSVETDESLESYGTRIGDGESPTVRATEWLLVNGNRMGIATLIVAAVFVFLNVLHWFGLIAFVNDDSITRLAGGMVAGTFSLVTLVVSINQLILSREFSAAGEVRGQLDGVMQFREDIEATTNVPASPASPGKLLQLLVVAIDDRAGTLAETVSDQDDEFRELVQRYVNGVGDSTERIDETLEETAFGTFNAVAAAINYDDAWQLYAARQLRNSHADAMSDEALAAFDDLIESLQQFVVAREHFITTYMQRELTRFSQLTIYSGIPSILAGVVIGLMYADLRGATISFTYLPYVTMALISIIVIPLALLASYILRTATVARRTTSVGPMLPQKDPEEGPFEVSYGDEE